MDKNCFITIKTKGTIANYRFDDYRIAIAIRNILDNVAEIDPDNITNMPKLKYISKDVEMLENNEDNSKEGKTNG
jgi:hypothetical protein